MANAFFKKFVLKREISCLESESYKPQRSSYWSMSFAESFSPSSQHKRLCLWQDHWSGEWTMTSVTGNIEELPKSWRLHWTLKFEIRKFQIWQRWRWRRWRWRNRGSRRSRERCRFKWNLNRSDLILNFWWAIIGIINGVNSMMIMMMTCPALWYVEPSKCGTVPILSQMPTPATPRSMKNFQKYRHQS